VNDVPTQIADFQVERSGSTDFVQVLLGRASAAEEEERYLLFARMLLGRDWTGDQESRPPHRIPAGRPAVLNPTSGIAFSSARASA
jgi:hypothetical protein